ncbi:hypothetical protein FSARC_13365 [Fusarium sarcochroum]|uniref:Uncharacterized protein n=1 Tax=Fusarium sarcochroum TaxID=1208366 RepID=A0A8H4WT73_9HYPO|nr:hypothetical protein FSARC_13365 [Fusarium sarcochroum]
MRSPDFDLNYHHALDWPLLPLDQTFPDATWATTSGAAVGYFPSHFPSTLYSAASNDLELRSSKSFNHKLATPLKGSPAARDQDIDAYHLDHNRVTASATPTSKPPTDAHSFTTPETPDPSPLL